MKQTAIVLLALLQYAIVLNAAPSDPSLKVASHDFMDAFSKRAVLIDSLMHKLIQWRRYRKMRSTSISSGDFG